MSEKRPSCMFSKGFWLTSGHWEGGLYCLSLYWSEGDQPWDFFGRNDAKAETPVLWPPHGKSWLIRKDSDAGRDWGQEEKGTTEDEMAGWHHWLDGRESGWTLGVGDGQGGPVCCDSWGCRVGHDWATDLIWLLKPKPFISSTGFHLCFHQEPSSWLTTPAPRSGEISYWNYIRAPPPPWKMILNPP